MFKPHWHLVMIQRKSANPYARETFFLVLVEIFKAHLVMIQRDLKSANPYARETEKGPRPGGTVKALAFSSSQLHLNFNSDC